MRDEEARALDRTWRFLLDLGSGAHPARPIGDLRKQARGLARHYPLAAGSRWMEAGDEDLEAWERYKERGEG